MNSSRSAMSFLELIIVILVVGVMAAVATPRFDATMRASHVRAAAIQIAGHIRYVRRIAINEGRSTAFALDDANRSYSSDVDFPSRIDFPIDVDLKDDFDGSIAIRSNLDGQHELTFDLEGVPHVLGTPLLSGTILISSPGVTAYRISIAPGTGETTITPFSDAPIEPNVPDVVTPLTPAGDLLSGAGAI